eukprot:5046492-Prymnesium_polylepis.1
MRQAVPDYTPAKPTVADGEGGPWAGDSGRAPAAAIGTPQGAGQAQGRTGTGTNEGVGLVGGLFRGRCVRNGARTVLGRTEPRGHFREAMRAAAHQRAAAATGPRSAA